MYRVKAPSMAGRSPVDGAFFVLGSHPMLLPGMVGPLVATYSLQTITPAASGWRVVYWDGTRHTAEAIYLIGLANNTTPGDPPLIATFTYAPATSWQYCEGRPDYCGLLPPGGDLAHYEAHDPNGHVPTPARETGGG